MALWIVATPLGSLSDVSPHVREVLSSVSAIACEDTRTTRRLLSALEISAPELLAYHAHNAVAQAEGLAARAVHTELAIVTDAGTPAVSDPGEALVAVCHRLGVEIRNVPGPSALVCALASSGFPAAPSVFLGFPPRKGREGWAAEALTRPETLVFFEAPSRVISLLHVFAAMAPEREAVLSREISKKYEQHRRMALAEWAKVADDEEIRGECVVVIGPGAPRVVDTPRLAEEAGLKDVASALAQRWGVPSRDVYRRLLDLKAEF